MKKEYPVTQDSPSRPWKAKDYGLMAAAFVPAAIVTWGVHESAHWAMGVALGYEMWVTFNQAGPAQGSFDHESHQVLVSLAGPLITWIQAVVAFGLIREHRQLWIYPFLFLTFWMRSLAMGISLVSNPNDEARISLIFSMPIWVLPLMSVLFLLLLTFHGSRLLKVGWKGNITAYVAASVMSTAIVFSDQFLFFS